MVRFLTRKFLLVANVSTQEYFIKSHISKDGYVVLLTQYDTYLPLQYKVFKKNFLQVFLLVDGNSVSSVTDNNIILSSGESIKLADINEPITEDSADFF
jgi:hypothetical protein